MKSTIERRLADYGPQLDAAVDQRPMFDPTNAKFAQPTTNGLQLVDADLRAIDAGDHSRRPFLAIAAAAVLLVGGIGIVMANRWTTDDIAVSSAPENEQDVVTPATEPGGEQTVDDDVSIATAPNESGEGSAPDECLAPPATLYLGGDDASATPGFIVSAPLGTSLDALAIRAIVNPVVGAECGGNDSNVVKTSANETTGSIDVTVLPPAAPIQMDLTLSTAETAAAIGVTNIQGATEFTVDRNGSVPVLQLGGGAPPEGAATSVRFRKGTIVWEVSTETTTGSIPLEVPAVETDAEPDAPVEWVLFTIRDEEGFVIDTGGTVTS